MKGIRKTRFLMGAAAAGLALVAGFVLWAQVSAQAPSISVDNVSVAPGEEATVNISSSVPGGLGAWTLDITYDPEVVTPTGCDGGDENSVCNENFADDAVRITGASATGTDDDTVLGSITFAFVEDDCDGASSDLSVSISVLADPTIGDPQDISADADVSDGSVTCEIPAEESPTVLPTLPPTGAFDGASGGSDDLGWVLAALAMAGVAAVAGLGALRMRNNQ
jgi:hypothetical protein